LPELMDVNALATSGLYQEHTEFWKKALGRIEGNFRFSQNWQSYALPFGPPPDYAFEMDGEAGEFLRGASQGKDLNALVVLLAGLFRVIEKYTGSPDFFVDSPRLATENPSDFTGFIPLIAVPAAGATVREYLNRVRETVQGSYSYQDFPVTDFAGKFSNVAIRFHGLHEPEPASHDLTIAINRGERLEIALEANPAVFTLHFLQHFARHWRNAVAGFRDLDLPLGSVSLLDEEERLRLRPSTESVRVDRTVLEFFAARAEAAPNSIAIVTDEGQMTYGELDDRSSRLACFLGNEYSIGRGDTVGILSDRSERWVIGLLGILKAGGVYLPLDPEYPQERLRFMIEDANVRALLVHSEYLPLLTDFWAIPMVALDFQLAALDPAPASLPTIAQPDDPAYIIYTSGSTGVPKGVVLRHRGLLNMALHHVEAFGFDAADRLVQFYSPSFDGSMMEVFVALLAGARLVLVRPDLVKDVPRFSEYIAEQGVTTINALPVYLSALDWDRLGSIKRIVSAGDNARVSDACRLAKTRSYHNSYGPTEATVCVTDYVVDPNAAYGTRLPVGKPIQNVRIYLLDENRDLAPEGCRGEICISGIALAHGYLNRDDLTAAAFIANPFEPGERLYRTGDLGVWLPDGNLEIAGRRDSQVKIRGYRIELGEIEAVLRQQNAVGEAVVMVREDPARGKYLVAWVTGAGNTTDLRESLKTRLPDFMLPAAIFTVERMPLTPNGKIDRKALAALTPESDTGSGSYTAPGSGMEERITAIWRELLGRERIGIHDNFFELGGDSILIIRAVSRAQQAGIKMTAKQHFEHPTIAALAKVAVDTSATGVAQEPVAGPAALTPAQQWFFAQEVEDPHHYNQSAMVEVPASLAPHVIEQALAVIVEHHDALRLAFFRVGTDWEQLHAARVPAVPFGVTQPGDAAMLSVAAVLQESFDLSQPPLLRAHLFRLGLGQPARLLLIAHHLVIDGVSWRIVLEDLHTACRQIEASEPVRLPAKTTPLRDWSRRLAELGATHFEGLDYWLRKTSEFPPSFDGIARGVADSAASIDIEFHEEETIALLQKAPKALNADVNEILLTALLLAFRDWTGNGALLVDLEGHGREDIFDDVDLSRTVGWFTALYPMLLDAGDAVTPAEVLRIVKEQLREVPMRGLGYGIVRPRIASEPAPVLFNYMGQIDRVLPEGTEWKPVLGFHGPEHSPRARRPHLFEVEGIVFEGHLRLTWTYNRAAYGREAIENLAQSYRENLLLLIETSGGGSHGLSPTDFPAARIDGNALKTLVARMNS